MMSNFIAINLHLVVVLVVAKTIILELKRFSSIKLFIPIYTRTQGYLKKPRVLHLSLEILG